MSLNEDLPDGQPAPATTDATPVDAPAAPASKSPMNWRGRRPSVPRLDADKAVRQGDAVRLAIAAFGNAAAATQFLNTPHPALGGRPIDRALSDAEGLEAVAAELRLVRSPR